jgi:hypothetical protein
MDMKCLMQTCYKTATVYGYCLVCWNKLPVDERNRAVRKAVEYGKWQLDEIEDNVLTQIQMQSFNGAYCNPDMAKINGSDFHLSQTYGMYFPPKDRIFMGHGIDFRNDGAPDEASLSIPGGSHVKITSFDAVNGLIDKNSFKKSDLMIDGIERNSEFIDILQQTLYLRKIKKPPKGWVCLGGGEWYVLLYGKYVKSLRHFTAEDSPWNAKSIPDKPGLFYEKMFLRIDWKNESISAAIRTDLNFRKYPSDRKFQAAVNNRVETLVSTCLSAEADSKYLWNVRAFKMADNEHMEGNVRFGVYGEHVKSLFFARDLPLTESGRKKPILHWVSAHKRRLQAGQDIDIEKHLRGTRGVLAMGDYRFIITRPCENEEYDFSKWARRNGIRG